MALEQRDHGPDKERRAFLKGAAAGASAFVGGVAGGALAMKDHSEQVNAHTLSPAAIAELRKSYGASDLDIANLEESLKQLLPRELSRIMRQRQT
jgi:hypothetical protein